VKFLCALWLIGLACVGGTTHAQSVNGRSYVALSQWARANGFGGYTFNSGHNFIFTNKTSRVSFEQDSADVTLNGIDVRLAFPVAKGGFISQLDADKTLRPLLFMPRPGAKRITTICLDPGHGGKDTGNRVGKFLFAHSEKTYTLALALELRRQLQQAGFNVILTRDKDIYPALPVRYDIANRRGADLFVSLHFNAFPGNPAAVQGAETYCMTPVGAASSNDAEGAGLGSRAYPANRVDDRSLLLAYQVQRTLTRGLGATDRGVRRARFEVLRGAEMPAILVEGGYMSHPAEGKKIFTDLYRRQMATAIVSAIVNYQKLTAPPPTPAPVATKSKTTTSKPGKESIPKK
jgi:N-acetylmuramoyl-L-alanine amidase